MITRLIVRGCGACLPVDGIAGVEVVCGTGKGLQRATSDSVSDGNCGSSCDGTFVDSASEPIGDATGVLGRVRTRQCAVMAIAAVLAR